MRPVLAVISTMTLLSIAVCIREGSPFLVQLHGGRQAQKDWSAGVAKHYYFAEGKSHGIRRGEVCYEYDRTTGFKNMPGVLVGESFAENYNSRIEALLKEHGSPDWSMKDFLINERELLSLLDIREIDPVLDFPYHLGDSIVLFKDDTSVNWSRGTESGDGLLLIITKADGRLFVGERSEAVYVIRKADFPGVVFVRNGAKWIGMFHEESGRLLMWINRG